MLNLKGKALQSVRISRNFRGAAASWTKGAGGFPSELEQPGRLDRSRTDALALGKPCSATITTLKSHLLAEPE